MENPNLPDEMQGSERYNFCQETITLFTQMQIGYLALAQRLWEIKANRLYLPHWESFNAYCMEMNDMSSSVISRLVNIHERLVLEAGIPSEDISEAGWSKVAVALPIIHDKESAQHWVGLAKQLSKTDLAREVKEYRSGRPMKDCDHKNFYIIKVCRDCGYKWRIENADDPENKP